MRSFFLSLSAFSLVACGGGADGEAIVTMNTQGDPINGIVATNGQDQFLIVLTEGFLVYKNIDLVSEDLDAPVALIDAGTQIDFVTNSAFVFTQDVPQVEYQQINAGLDETAAVAFHALGTIDINGDGPIPFSIDYQLPAEDANEFDNAFDVNAANGNEDSFTLDLEALFSNIDYVAIEDDQFNDVTINAETALDDLSVQTAIDAFTAVFSANNNNPPYLED